MSKLLYPLEMWWKCHILTCNYTPSITYVYNRPMIKINCWDVLHHESYEFFLTWAVHTKVNYTSWYWNQIFSWIDRVLSISELFLNSFEMILLFEKANSGFKITQKYFTIAFHNYVKTWRYICNLILKAMVCFHGNALCIHALQQKSLKLFKTL